MDVRMCGGEGMWKCGKTKDHSASLLTTMGMGQSRRNKECTTELCTTVNNIHDINNVNITLENKMF